MYFRTLIPSALLLALSLCASAPAQEVEPPAPVEVPQVEVPQVDVPQVEPIPGAEESDDEGSVSSCSCPQTLCEGGSVEGCSVTCPPSNVGGAVCGCGGSCDEDGNPQGVNRCNCE